MSDLSLGSAGGSLGITFLPSERSSVDLERGPEGLQRCHLPMLLLHCCVQCRLQAWHAVPGRQRKALVILGGFVFFPNLQLTGGSSQRVRRKRSLAPLHGFPFIYFLLSH